jgi:Ca2+:H+ antiporter
MAMQAGAAEWMPWWSWAPPLLAWALLGGMAVRPEFGGGVVVGLAALLLAALLLAATVFAAVHHAEVVALRVGEPFGSLVLAMAVTVIEVALIV